MENKNASAPPGAGRLDNSSGTVISDIAAPQPVVQPISVPITPQPVAPPISRPSFTPTAPVAPPKTTKLVLTRRQWILIIAGALVLLSIIVLVIFWLATRGTAPNPGSSSAISVPLGKFAGSAKALSVGTAQTVSVNGQLQVSNSLVLSPSLRPSSATAGQIYFDKTSNQLNYYNGTDFVALLGGNAVNNLQSTTINGALNAVTSPSNSVGHLAKFTAKGVVGDSVITDDGTNVTVDGNLNLINTTPTADVTIWSPSVVPTNPSYLIDHAAVEVGTKFQTDIDGIVRGVRFYKGPTNVSTHIGNLWSSSGTLLATGTFTNETSTGWQELRFANPVAIAAGATYIVSYHTDVGQYAADLNYFKSGGFDNPPLHALQEGADGPNGVFKYSGTSTFPTTDSAGVNYWVDVVFSPSASPRHYQINGAQISSTALSNNYDLAKRSTGQVFSGINTFRNATDSDAGFEIQSADTTPLLTAVTNSKLVIIKKLIVTGDIRLDNHLTTNGLAPKSITGGPAACTTPTVTVSGNDISGVITVASGTGCASSGIISTLTFNSTFDTPPRVILTPANTAAATTGGVYVDSAGITANTFDVSLASGTLTNSTTYKWYYQVIQ